MDFKEWSKYNLGYTGEDAYKAGQQSKQAEIDALNGNIIDLRRQLEAQNKVNDRDFATAECGKDWYVHEEA